jgi:hypothetical protein
MSPIPDRDRTPAKRSGKIAPRTLANWRSRGLGPKFAKIGGRVLYRLADVEAWEDSRTFRGTDQYTAD